MKTIIKLWRYVSMVTLLCNAENGNEVGLKKMSEENTAGKRLIESEYVARQQASFRRNVKSCGARFGIEDKIAAIDQISAESADRRFNGYRTVNLADGNLLEGEWTNGVLNGFGVLKSETLKIQYSGHWKMGKKHGFGKLICDLFVYSGLFCDDYPIGRGVYEFTSGIRLEGVFVPRDLCEMPDYPKPTVWFESSIKKQRKANESKSALSEAIELYERKLAEEALIASKKPNVSLIHCDKHGGDLEMLKCDFNISKVNIDCSSVEPLVSKVECNEDYDSE